SWWRIDRPTYLVTHSGVIRGERSPAEHAETMLSDSFAGRFVEPADARAWREAVRTGDAIVTRSPGSSELKLKLRSNDADRAQQLLQSVWRAYEAHLLASPVDVRRTTRWKEWRRQLDHLTSQLDDVSAQIQQTRSRRDAMPEHLTWDEAISALNAAQSELAEIRLKAADQQRLVEQLAHTDPRPSEVLESQVLAALSDDPVYNEDFKEYAAYAQEYQHEFADAVARIRAALVKLRQSLEQMAGVADRLATPQVATATRAALEEVRTAVGVLAQNVTGLESAWADKLDAVQRIDPVDQLVQLVRAQNTAQDDTAKALQLVHDGVAGIEQRVRALASADDLRAAERVASAELEDALHRIS
ncbi:MAG: hypothetical protein D6744_18605, partial [Planctomycetota bacterium]